MQHIFENFGYFYCFGEVSALDGENIDIFKNLSFTCTDRCHPQLSPIKLQLEFQSTFPSTIYQYKKVDYFKETVLTATLYCKNQKYYQTSLCDKELNFRSLG